MATIECHGCLRQIEDAEIRWILYLTHLAGRTGNVLHLGHTDFDHPEPGAVPYCPACREASNAAVENEPTDDKGTL